MLNRGNVSVRGTVERLLLNSVAVFFDEDATHDDFNWSRLSYTDVLGFLNVLVEDNKAPNTINTYLAAIKGVTREAWKLNIMGIDQYHRIKEIKCIRGSRDDKGRALDIDELNAMIDHSFSQEGPVAMRDACLIALVYMQVSGARKRPNFNFHTIMRHKQNW